MTAQNKRERSPNYPRFTLEDALRLAKKLYDSAGRSTIGRDVAAKALGYNGLNGAALGALAGLLAYGLVDGAKGNVTISTITLEIFHPLDDVQKENALRRAALTPSIFQLIHSENRDCNEDVLAHQLVHKRFSVDAARKIAGIYKDNFVFAKLERTSNLIPRNEPRPGSAANIEPQDMTSAINTLAASAAPVSGTRELPIPIGEGDRFARIPFPISEEDFALFIDTLQLWKRKLIKKPDGAAVAAEDFSATSSAEPSPDGIRTRTRNQS